MENFDIASLKIKKAPATKKSVSISVKPSKSIFGSISKKSNDHSIDDILDDKETKRKNVDDEDEDKINEDKDEIKDEDKDEDDDKDVVKLMVFDKRKTAFINRNNILERINETIIENRIISKAPVVL